MSKRLLIIGITLVILAASGSIVLCYLLSGCGSAEKAISVRQASISIAGAGDEGYRNVYEGGVR